MKSRATTAELKTNEGEKQKRWNRFPKKQVAKTANQPFVKQTQLQKKIVKVLQIKCLVMVSKKHTRKTFQSGILQKLSIDSILGGGFRFLSFSKVFKMNLSYFTPLKGIETLLPQIVNSSRNVESETHTKPRETMELQMTKHKQGFFDGCSIVFGKWLMGVTNILSTI